MFLLSFIATISHTKKGVLSVVCSVLGHPPQIRPLSLVEDTVECKSYLVLIATIYDFIWDNSEKRRQGELRGHRGQRRPLTQTKFGSESAFLFQNHFKSKHLLWLQSLHINMRHNNYYCWCPPLNLMNLVRPIRTTLHWRAGQIGETLQTVSR